MSSEPALETDDLPRRERARGAPRDAVIAVVITVAATVGLAALIDQWWLHEGALAWRAGALALCGGALVLWLAAKHFIAPAFGAANAVTLARGALALLLVALLGVDAGTTLGWVLVGVGVLAVALDGVDGALARGRGEASAFGARFDMETDALLILVLAALVWQQEKAGAWVLLAGLLRYAFVAASYVRPWLGAQLPPSRRRQAVCVLQIASLLAALVPFLAWPSSAVLAAAGLAALSASFAVDVVWLVRHTRT